MTSLRLLFSGLHSPSDIASVLGSVKSAAKELLIDEEKDGVLLDLNSLRSLVADELLGTTNKVQMSVCWLCFLQSYLEVVGPEKLLEVQPVAEYVLNLIANCFNRLDISIVYYDQSVTKLFNAFITNFVKLNGPLSIKYLEDSSKQFSSIDPDTLNFLQTFTVRHLFQQRQFEEIVSLFDDTQSKICDFSRIDPDSLSREDILQFYFDVARSLFIQHRYRDAYSMFGIIFGLPVNLGERSLIEELLSVYVITLLFLKKDYTTTDANLLRFYSLIPVNLLNIFECFQTCQLSQFVRLVYLEYIQRHEANKEEEYLFSREVTVSLVSTLACEKYRQACGKLHNVPESEVSSINPTVEVLNILGSLGIYVDTKQTEEQTVSEVSTDSLLDSIGELSQSNERLGRNIEENKRLWQVKQLQKLRQRVN